MMRKISSLITIAVAFLISAPSLSAQEAKMESVRLRVMASFYPMQIAALNITKDVPGVQVSCMVKPFVGCLHDYQMTTDDMASLAKADVLVVNGAGMESFLDKLIKQKPQLKIICASSGIELIKDQNGEANPHVWVSISNAITQAKNIAEGLASLDPANGDKYRSNAKGYVEKLEALKKKMNDEFKDLKTRDIITFHEAFPYFAQEFKLKIAAVIEREPGSEPSARELADTIKLIRKSGVKALFAEPQYPAKSAETIAKETGAQLFVLDPCVSGKAEPEAYLKAMEQNLETLKKALK